MTEETRIKLSLPELVDPPEKPYLNPFPPKGRVYDYKFVKEVLYDKVYICIILLFDWLLINVNEKKFLRVNCYESFQLLENNQQFT